MRPGADTVRCGWTLPMMVATVVLVAQLALVAAAGTDIPFYDQWGIEGQWLYPAWRAGSLHWMDLLAPFNEHRITWTHLLNLALFAANGQWDPLAQLVANAVLRVACAGGLTWWASAGGGWRLRGGNALGVTCAFLPLLAWHNALWGNQSQAYFVLGFSLASLAMLGAIERSTARTVVGLSTGIAALFAMAPGALVPVALLGMACLRAVETRDPLGKIMRQAWPAVLLLVAAWLMRVSVAEHAGMRPTTAADFVVAAGRLLAWPHVDQPLAAVVMNLPMLLVVSGRLLKRRAPTPGEDFVLLAGGWSMVVALATAWMRGGSAELTVGVPSRYVDFLVLLPLANAWCIVVLMGAQPGKWRTSARLVATAWGLFLVVGWAGLSAQMWRNVIGPRMRDHDAPARLTRAYQITGDAAVFAGKPRLLVPHPNLEVVRGVLNDPRLRGALPPSLQPERPMGPLSRAVRWLLGRSRQ